MLMYSRLDNSHPTCWQNSLIENHGSFGDVMLFKVNKKIYFMYKSTA